MEERWKADSERMVKSAEEAKEKVSRFSLPSSSMDGRRKKRADFSFVRRRFAKEGQGFRVAATRRHARCFDGVEESSSLSHSTSSCLSRDSKLILSFCRSFPQDLKPSTSTPPPSSSTKLDESPAFFV